MCILFKSFKTKLKIARSVRKCHTCPFICMTQSVSCLLNEKFKICQFKLDYNILVLILIIYGRL